MTPFISLFNRIRNFERQDLETALYDAGCLLRVRCVRGTVYILTREFAPLAMAATMSANIPMSGRYLNFIGFSEREYRRLSGRILDVLKSGREMTAAEIRAELKLKKSLSSVINLMCDEGLLIRWRPAKGWRTSLNSYALFSDKIPNIDLRSIDPIEARRSVVDSYIRVFGPVSLSDIAWWTGFPKGEVAKTIETPSSDIIEVEVDSRRCIISKSDLEKAGQALVGPVVNLLPQLDAFIMGYKERARYLDDKDKEFVFDRSGNATSTILIDGLIVGVWDYFDKPKPMIKTHLFKRLSHECQVMIEHEAKRIGEFIYGGSVWHERCAKMTPLTARTAGAFMSPLKDTEQR